jgi:hypothetical protein
VSGYDEPLCKLVDNDARVKIWNNEWLDPKLIVGYSEQSIIDRNVIKDIKPSILFVFVRKNVNLRQIFVRIFVELF